jgi:hypothetical protein
MRKLIASVMLVGFALGVVGCGEKKPAAPATPPKDAAPAVKEGEKAAAPAPAPKEEKK